jgi:hypothetical protein
MTATATLIPFPILRRHGFIQRIAAQAACMSPDSSSRYIGHQLQVQREAMRRRGIREDHIVSELRLMEAAIRQELAQCTVHG